MLTEYAKSLKDKKKLTNQQIAQMSGVSESTISRFFKGESKSVDLSTCVDIIRALGGSMDEACGFMVERGNCTGEIKNCIDCPKHASMREEFLEFYTEEIRRDIIETMNTRVAEYKRISEARIADEKAHFERLLEQNKEHYAQMSADKGEMHKHRIDNLMSILDARNKTINRLSVICGAMAICLIALLIINIFFPTNPIIKW